MYRDIESLQMGLPEDILKQKWAGDLTGALASIDARLAENLPEMLRTRLTVERALLKRLPRLYTLSRQEALSSMCQRIPGFTEAEFDRLERDNFLDYLYLGGEKRYFCRFLNSLLKTHPGLAERAGQPISPARPLLDRCIQQLKERGRLDFRIRLRATLRIDEEAFVPGELYRVHLPLPAPAAQISNIRLLASDPEPWRIASPSHPQRTACFEQRLERNHPFVLEYEYDVHLLFADPLGGPLAGGPLYPAAPSPTQDDLGERAPHMLFTPYLRSLAQEIQGAETDPIRIARRFYDFITTRVRYSFVRDYFLIDNISEYAALNLKGDCGIQALLFITLCRIAGIPARWQSGLYTDPQSVGSHDWAQFYVEPWGWLFCDCSFGGSAYRAGNPERWNFYFGNLDPYRMVANSDYQQEFDPPKRFLRIDPYDNQQGECECSSKGFGPGELDTCHELVSMTPIAPQ